jgi:hypothetical protein
LPKILELIKAYVSTDPKKKLSNLLNLKTQVRSNPWPVTPHRGSHLSLSSLSPFPTPRFDRAWKGGSMVGVGRICRPSFRCGHRPSPSTLSLPSAAVANSPLSPLLPPCLLLPHNRDGTMDARSDVVASSTERACGGGSSPCRSWINVRWQGEAAKGDLAALQLPPVANPNKMSSQVNPRWSADELDEWFR